MLNTCLFGDAMGLERNWIGCELNEENREVQKDRIIKAQSKVFESRMENF